MIILLYAQRQFHFSLSNFDAFNFFCLPHCTDSTMLNGNTGRGHICFFCGLRRKPSVFHHYDVSDRVFARGRFSGLRKLSSIPHLQRSVFLFCFILKRICIKSQLQWSITLHPSEWPSSKKSTDDQCWRGNGEKGSLLHRWWECKLVQSLWRTVWRRFLKKWKIGLSGGPVVKNLPASAGDMDSILGPGRFHMTWSN